MLNTKILYKILHTKIIIFYNYWNGEKSQRKTKNDQFLNLTLY